jgi:multicomponent Na+:H+ antiporter subunit B
MAEQKGLSVIVRVVSRWTTAIIMVYGLGVAFFGHVTPGGGFAGGVIVACGFVLATLGFSGKTGPVALFQRISASLEAGGALVYAGMGAAGWALGTFFQNWLGRGEVFTLGSAPFCVLINIAIMVKVSAGLFAGFMGLVLFERLVPDWEENGGGK